MVQHPQINVIYHTNKRKDKNHMIISINTEKSFDKIQHPFTVKTPIKVLMEGAYVNIIKIIYDIYDKSIANITLNVEELKAFLIISATKKIMPTLNFI